MRHLPQCVDLMLAENDVAIDDYNSRHLTIQWDRRTSAQLVILVVEFT